VALQVFSAPNAFPLGANYRRTPRAPDLLAPLAIASGWPARTWTSPLRRALHQAGALRRLAGASGGRLRVVESRDDLADLDGTTGALLSLEGIHGVRDDLRAIDALFDAGFRIFGIAHMSDTALAGSAHGWRRGGLTAPGIRVIRHLESRGAIVDLAHASERTIDDVLDTLERAPLVSHTGVRGTCPGPRNLSDRNLERIAARGGLIGIAFFPAAVGGRTAAAVATAIRHAVAVAGADHVALGSDFDGAVPVPFDAARLVELTAALLEAGLDADAVARVMGLSARRFLSDALPRARV
jgi:microsomal dipeptidase-like Zn-dependent dipeptidase